MSQMRRRSETVQVTDTVQLRAVFKDGSGEPIRLDTFPTVSIFQPSGLVCVGKTSAGVCHIEPGVYGYDFKVDINGAVGVWSDHWAGLVNGFPIQSAFNFVVDNTQLQSITTDEKAHLGDDIGFNYTQTAIFNIDKILKGLRASLKSQGKMKIRNKYGEYEYKDGDIFTVDQLVTYCALSLSDFNQTPYFTMFTFEDTSMIDQFLAILTKGARLYALAAQALIEKGREFQITDNGLQFTPPTVAEMLNTQYNTQFTQWFDQLKMIKTQFRPAPKGLGTLTISTTNPNVMRLRHLRARRYF